MEKDTAKSTMDEKRVKPTIIRRRAKIEAPTIEEVSPKLEGVDQNTQVELEVAQKENTTLTSPQPISSQEQQIIENKKTEELPASIVKPVLKTQELLVKKQETSSVEPKKNEVIKPIEKQELSTASQIAENNKSTSSVKPIVSNNLEVGKTVTVKTTSSNGDEDRPRFGLKIVGKIDLKSAGFSRDRTGPSKTTSTASKTPANKTSPSVTAKGPVANPLIPEVVTEEENQKTKAKKTVKKGKRDELEVDLEGIGKVATLTQLTRLAAAVNPHQQTRVERERVFEPGKTLRKKKGALKKEVKKVEVAPMKASKRVVKMGEMIVISDLAHEMSVKATELIKKLIALGNMATVNQSIDFDTATILAQDFGYEVRKDVFEEESILKSAQDTPDDLQPRCPVVTVMGHVDHGKTSLLDAIRKTSVVSGEAGGITQHIGAYQVKTEKGLVTFLDTPGHEAFTAMRARGASVTDIVIIVVAADEGIMPQTVEAIHHAQAAKVPIIVAVNKMDKPEANPDQVKRQLAEHHLVPEEWGGDTIYVYVSAKSGLNMDQLLEMILLQSEVLELKVNPNKAAKGVVIESKLDKGKGPVATVLIQEGTLKTQDHILAGSAYGRVRAMKNDQGVDVKQAGPCVPVEVLGLSSVPNAGEVFYVLSDEQAKSDLVEHRAEREKQQRLAASSRASLEDLFSQIQKGDVKELRVILKADVQGSLEALKASLEKIIHDKIRIQILHGGVGGITESDIMLAAASNAVVVGFNVRPDTKALNTAQTEKVEVKVYDIIYNVIDDIKKAMEGLLEPTLKEKYLGRAEIRNVFNITKVGNVAGVFVVDGVLQRNAKVRLLRDNVIVYQGKLDSLKRFKEDAKEVSQGYECGLSLENYNDIKVGDVVEAFLVESIATKI